MSHISPRITFLSQILSSLPLS